MTATVKNQAKESTMFNNSVGRWMMLALAIALAAWGASYTLPGVQLVAQNEKLVLPESDRSVKSFGAKGDGVSDDAAVIQKAVDGKARTIRFPAGIYRISKTIEVDLDQVGWTAFVGDGTARIVMTGPGPAIRFIGTHEGTADPASFKENVWVKQRMPRVSGLEIVGSHPAADGIEASGTMQLTVESTLLRELRHGVRLVKRNRNVLISACHIYHNGGAGVYLDHVNLHQTNIVGSHISYNGGGGVVVRGGEVRNVHISGCDIEANMDTAGEPTANVLFDSSGLQLHNVQDSDAGLTLTDCRRMHVSGNTILDCDKIGMLLTNLSDSRVADNLIRDDRGESIPLKAVGGRGNWFTGNMWTGQPNIEPSAGAVQNNFAAQGERGGGK